MSTFKSARTVAAVAQDEGREHQPPDPHVPLGVHDGRAASGGGGHQRLLLLARGGLDPAAAAPEAVHAGARPAEERHDDGAQHEGEQQEGVALGAAAPGGGARPVEAGVGGRGGGGRGRGLEERGHAHVEQPVYGGLCVCVCGGVRIIVYI